MSKILVVTPVESDGTLPQAAGEALGAAITLKEMLEAELCIGIWGQDVDMAIENLGTDAVSSGFKVEGEAFTVSRYASDAAACEAICRQAKADIVITPDSVRTNRTIAGVAFRLNGVSDTHITEFKIENGDLVVSRWHYRQRILAHLKRSQRPWFISIESGVFIPPQGDSKVPSTEALSVDVNDALTRTTVKGIETPAGDEQTIRPDAELLFVAGAGWTKKQPDGEVKAAQAADIILEFLKESKSSLGSTKSLVDLSSEGAAVLPFMTQLNQVGQTGSTPRHDKGLATCCHGEEPHVVGWRFVNERRVINLDPNCGWAHGKADVLYVADAFTVMQKVNELLGNQ
ncbi:electron transfer flavoprotein subunit alpha [candidate division KSB1 bacterium]|nr:electron transfer flavoprotein subunit alpha [candidate division KSB1 bacterium]